MEDPLSPPVIKDTEFGRIILTRYPDTNGKGIQFRVYERPVGEPSWKPLGDLIDSRRKEFGFQLIADVDFMHNHVLKDWSGFEEGDVCQSMMAVIESVIVESLSDIFESRDNERKTAAIKANLPLLRELPKSAQKRIGRIMDGILEIHPKMGDDDFKTIVQVIVNCEMSESGYGLMDKLATASPSEFDDLYSVLSDWSIKQLKIVHEELNHRMSVVKKLRQIVDNPDTDELHVLHPIFEKNLWIFGPEYDSCSYLSNKTITTILRRFFNEPDPDVDRRRPDIVMLPNSSLSAYSADRFGPDGEAEGLEKIVILELKRGGFRIQSAEKHQATDYATEISTCGSLNSDVRVMCYVLGSTVDPRCEGDATEKSGQITIRPLTYDALLRKAEVRLFDLIHKMEEANPDIKSSGDPAIDRAISENPLITPFENS